MTDKPAVHFHVRLERAGLYRCRRLISFSARAADADRLRRRNDRARRRVRAIRFGGRRRGPPAFRLPPGWRTELGMLQVAIGAEDSRRFRSQRPDRGDHIEAGDRVLAGRGHDHRRPQQGQFSAPLCAKRSATIEDCFVSFSTTFFPEEPKILRRSRCCLACARHLLGRARRGEEKRAVRHGPATGSRGPS